MGPVDPKTSASVTAPWPFHNSRSIVAIAVGPSPRVARSSALTASQFYAPPSWLLAAWLLLLLVLLPARRPGLLSLCGLCVCVGASDLRSIIEGNVLGRAPAGELGAALPSKLRSEASGVDVVRLGCAVLRARCRGRRFGVRVEAQSWRRGPSTERKAASGRCCPAAQKRWSVDAPSAASTLTLFLFLRPSVSVWCASASSAASELAQRRLALLVDES